MKIGKSARAVFASALGIAFPGATLGSVAGEEADKAQVDALRKSLEKYQDYKVAVRDLYLSTVGCVHYSGEKTPGLMEYPKGQWACTLSM